MVYNIALRGDMGKIFISYRRKDLDFVDNLVPKLKQRLNCEIFVDRQSSMDTEWPNVLLREIQECDIFILIVTEHTFEKQRITKDDDWIRKEVRLALSLFDKKGNPKPIVLVQLEGYPLPEPNEIPLDIQGVMNWLGVDIYRKVPTLFDASVGYLAQTCAQLAPVAFGLELDRQRVLVIPQGANLEKRLLTSVRDAVDKLVLRVQKDIQHRDTHYFAWTIAEGLIALLYADENMPDLHMGQGLPQALLANIARRLIRIDQGIEGGGIPAEPDLRIRHRGVVDSTAIVINALSSLRLYMFRNGAVRLNSPAGEVTLDEIEAAIYRLCFWLQQNQNDDKGWGLWKGTASRTTSTAYAVLAFIEAGENVNADFLQDAQQWLVESQHETGWWAITPQTSEEDVTSTAFALAALSMLCSTVIQDNIRKASFALETNEDWEDVVHTLEIPRENDLEKLQMNYASLPRAVYAMLIAGKSPASPFILDMLKKILERELPSGGWARQNSSDRRLDVWYTYVVIECIFTWFTYSREISYLSRLARADKALSGMTKLYQSIREENDRLKYSLEEIKNIINKN